MCDLYSEKGLVIGFDFFFKNKILVVVLNFKPGSVGFASLNKLIVTLIDKHSRSNFILQVNYLQLSQSLVKMAEAHSK